MAITSLGNIILRNQAHYLCTLTGWRSERTLSGATSLTTWTSTWIRFIDRRQMWDSYNRMLLLKHFGKIFDLARHMRMEAEKLGKGSKCSCVHQFYLPDRFWREMYCRWESDVHPRENLTDLTIASRDHINSLDDHIRLLQKRIKILESKLNIATSSTTINGISSTLAAENLTDNRFANNKTFYDEVS